MATENNTIRTKVSLDASEATQKIAKLNAFAADGTKTLEERVAAKNRQIEIQNKLFKQEISNLEKKIKALKETEGAEKELARAEKQLEKLRLKAVKTSANLAKQQNGLTAAMKNGKGAVNAMDNATGGLITKLSILAANPVVAVITAFVLTLKLLKEAFTSSEEGQNRWNKVVAITNMMLGNLLDVVADVAEWLVDMFMKPRESLKKFGDLIQDQLITRMNGMMTLIPKLSEAFKKLFDGDVSEAASIAAQAVGQVALGLEDVEASLKRVKKEGMSWAEQQAKELEDAKKVEDWRAEADKIERKLVEERAFKEAGIAKLRLKSRQEDKFGAEERRAALIEAQGLEEALIDSEVKYLSLRRDAQILENTFSRSNKENLMKEAQAKAAVNARIAARFNIARQVQREVTRIDGQIRKEAARLEKLRLAELARLAKIRADELAEMQRYADEEWRIHLETLTKKREADEAAAIEKQRIIDADHAALIEMDELEIERIQNKGEQTFDLEIALLIRKREHELAIFDGTLLEKKAMEKRYGVAIGKLQMEQVAASKKADADMLKSGVMAAAEMFGVSKEAAIALALIQAPGAISSVWTEAAKKPTLPQVLLHGIGGTAMVIAPIVKSLANIKKVKMKGKGGSGGGGSISVPTGIGTTNVEDLSANNAANLNAEAGLNTSSSAAACNNVNGAADGDIMFQEGQYNDFQDQIGFIEGQTNLD